LPFLSPLSASSQPVSFGFTNPLPPRNPSELVQPKLNIGASDGDSTPSEVKKGTPTYISGGLEKLDKGRGKFA
jgi:hypothetical protein